MRHIRLYCIVPDFIAFSAYKYLNQAPDDYNELLIFPGITTNIGDGYNNDTSTFTCPVDGIYYIFFNLHVLMEDPTYDWCDVQILLDGVVMAEVSEVLSTTTEKYQTIVCVYS